jgi:hypothetical protein
MRRPHREIEIFSMSVLDMFASALGAFIMIAIILFPYFTRDIDAQLSASRERVDRMRNELQSTEQREQEQRSRNRQQQVEVDEINQEQDRTRRCMVQLTACLRELSDTFLVVIMQWEEDVNVDLYVTNTAGETFSWNRHNRERRHYAGSDAQISFDVSGGPGIEVWLDPQVRPGDYKVEYRLGRAYGKDVRVSGYFIDRTGRRALPSKTLKDSMLAATAALLRLDAEGKIAIVPQ